MQYKPRLFRREWNEGISDGLGTRGVGEYGRIVAGVAGVAGVASGGQGLEVGSWKMRRIAWSQYVSCTQHRGWAVGCNCPLPSCVSCSDRISGTSDVQWSVYLRNFRNRTMWCGWGSHGLQSKDIRRQFKPIRSLLSMYISISSPKR